MLFRISSVTPTQPQWAVSPRWQTSCAMCCCQKTHRRVRKRKWQSCCTMTFQEWRSTTRMNQALKSSPRSIRNFVLCFYQLTTRREGGAEKEHSLTNAKLSASGMVTAWKNDHYVQGFAPTLKFLQSPVLCRCYISPLDETKLRSLACKKKSIYFF